MAETKKTPTRKWAQTFLKLLTLPREELIKHYAARSQVEKVLKPADILPQGGLYTEDVSFNPQIMTTENQKIVTKLYSKFFPDFEDLAIEDEYAENVVFKTFIKGNFIALHRWQIVPEDDIHDIYFFSVTFDALGPNSKTKFYIEDEATNDYITGFKLIKKSKLNYIMALVRFSESDKWHFVRFNDFGDKTFEESDGMFSIAKFELKRDEVPWIGNDRHLDFNECLNADNVYDFVAQTNDNFLWFGRVDMSAKSKDTKWQRQGFVKIGQAPTATASSNYAISNVTGLTVNSMVKKVSEKEEFYGNIVVSTQAGSSAGQFETRELTHKFGLRQDIKTINHTSSLPDWLYNETFDTFNRDFLDQYFTQTIEPNFLQDYKTVFSNPSNSEPQIIKNDLKITVGLLSYAKPPEEIRFKNEDGSWVKGSSTISKTFKLPIDLYNRVSSNPVVKYKLVQNSDKIDKAFLEIYIDTVKIGQMDIPSFEQPLTGNRFICYPYAELFDLHATYRHNLSSASYTSGKTFSLSIRDYEKNYNKQIFELDQEVDNVQNSAKAVTGSNNEVYVPIKVDDIWSLYLFDSKINLDHDTNLISKRKASRISRIASSNSPLNPEQITTFKIEEDAYSSPVIAVAVPNRLVIPYRNVELDKINRPWLGVQFSVAYYGDLEAAPIYWKEQNVLKILLNNKSGYRIYNVRYDGSAFGLNNYPYLFKKQDEWDTLKENFTPATIDGLNYNFSGTIDNVTINNNTLITTTTINKSSLNSTPSTSSNKSWSMMDNNGNVIYEFNKSIIKNPNDAISVNASLSFNWIEDGVFNQQMSNDFAMLWKDPSYIDKFRCRDIKYTITYPDGEKYTDYLTIDPENGVIEGNKLTVEVIFYDDEGGEPSVGHDFYIGDKEIDLWRPLNWEKLEFTGEPLFFKHSFTLEWKEH